MEALTTIWNYSTSCNKWLRIKDVTFSLSNEKLAELKWQNPHEHYKIDSKRPMKKPV